MAATYTQATRDGDPGDQLLYSILDELIREHHGHLEEATIALVWWDGVRPNQDERLKLARTRRLGGLLFELAGIDFAICVNREIWEHNASQRQALLDYELCRCIAARDAEGNVRKGADGRPVFKIRKPEFDGFIANVRRFGTWTAELRTAQEQLTLFDEGHPIEWAETVQPVGAPPCADAGPPPSSSSSQDEEADDAGADETPPPSPLSPRESLGKSDVWNERALPALAS